MRARPSRSAATAAIAVLALLVPAMAVHPTPVAAEPDIAYFQDVTGASVSVDGTYVPVVGHFTDPALDDIIWYARGTQTDHRWTPCPGCASGRFTKTRLQPQVTGSYQPIVGDFAGNRLDDIYWWTSDGASYLWTSNGSAGFTSRRFDAPKGYTDPLLLPDSRTGTGKDDLLWRKYPNEGGSTLRSRLWTFPDDGSGTARTKAQPIVPAAEPIVGDFDGNGAADVLWYVSTNGCTSYCRPPSAIADHLWRRNPANPGAITVTSLNIKGRYLPVVGRLSAADDTRDDILWIGGSYGSRGLLVDGPDSFWQGLASGSFRTSTVSIPFASGGIVLTRDDAPDVVVLSPPRGAQVWFQTRSGPVHREVGGGFALTSHTVVGRFTTADRDDVFVYQPGKGKEHLYHPIA